MANCIQQITKHSTQILEYSGKNIFRLGQYYQCLQNEHMNYNLISLINSTTNLLLAPIGFCLPKQCTTKQINFILNKILFNNSIGIEINTNKINQPQQYQYNTLFFITFILGIIIICLNLIGSIKNQKSNVQTSSTTTNILSYFNLKKSLEIFSKQSQNKLTVLNGIRSLAMIWVIFSHCITFSLSGAINSSTLQYRIENYLFLLVSGGFFAVDTFFFLGGFLVAYSIVRNISSSLIQYPFAILHRILRLWPAYISAILIYYCILVHLGSGPLWPAFTQSLHDCDNFWRPLIFVDNFINNGDGQCLGWGWYLQNDMQIFIACIFVLLIYSRNKIIGQIIIWLMIIGSLIFTMFYTYINNNKVVARLEDFGTWQVYFLDIYIKPYGRCPAYLLGLQFGLLYVNYLNNEQCFLNKFSKFIQSNRLYRIIFQWLGICLILYLILIPRTIQNGYEWPQILHCLYLCIGKMLFVFAVGLIITPSLLGCSNSFFQLVLDAPIWSFIAKISFCTYLVHLIVILQVLSRRSYDIYFTYSSAITIFFGLLTFSLFFGFLLTILVQVPFSGVQKILLMKLTKKKNKQKQLNQQKQIILEQQQMNQQFSKQNFNRTSIQQINK